MFCVKCGTKLPDDAKFCYNCGNEVTLIRGDVNRDDNESTIELNANVEPNTKITPMDREKQILQADKHGYMAKNPKTKKALLDILKDDESIEYIVMADEFVKTESASGGAFVITNQRMMFIIRNIINRNHSDKIYPLNTEIKQGKMMLIIKCIELGNEKYTFNFPEAIPTIIETQKRLLGISTTTNPNIKDVFICDIGTRWGKDKAQLYAGDNTFEIRLKGHAPRQIPIDEIYAARAGKESTVDILTKYSVISMKVNDKNSIVSTIQKYIINLKEFNFDNDKEHTDLLPSIIKSDFPYDIDKSNKKINIIRKYDRLVAPLRFDSFTEYLFFDVETLEKFDEKNFNSQKAALGWFLGGNSLKWGLSDKEYTLKIKLKSGYQCLVEAKDGMINITDIADINALK